MRDRREEILERLTQIAVDMVGEAGVFRNLDCIPEGPRPAILINDGDEAELGQEGPPRLRQAAKVAMTPEVTVFAAESDEVAVGAARAKMRRQWMAAIWSDATLREIVGGNGDVRYSGYGTRAVEGRLLIAEGGVAFAFIYPLLLKELEP